MLSNLEARLQIVREANPFPTALLDRMARWIETAPEDKLYRINPLTWAEGNEVDEDLAIDLFLHCARAGIFDLVWSVLCTSCGMLLTTPGGLRAFSRARRHCRL